MNPSSTYPCGRIGRRKFLFEAGLGFFGTAMGAMWAAEGGLPKAGRVREGARQGTASAVPKQRRILKGLQPLRRVILSG